MPPSGSISRSCCQAQKATDQARAANMRQGYVHDPLLEAATAAYVAGDITRDEYKERVVRKPQ